MGHNYYNTIIFRLPAASDRLWSAILLGVPVCHSCVAGAPWIMYFFLLRAPPRQHDRTYLSSLLAVIGNLNTKMDISWSLAMHCFSLDAVQFAW